jgi:hypothetical protein
VGDEEGGDEVVKPPEPLAAAAPESTRLDCLLSAGAMRPYLVALLRADDPGASCHVLDAKYVPGERCTVLYALGGRLVTGQLSLNGGLHGAEAGLKLWEFPDDPALPGLRLLTRPDGLRDVLAEALPEGPRLRGCRATLVRYRPHRRATLLLSAWLGDRLVRYVGKAYHDEGKAAAVYAETLRLASVGAGAGRRGPIVLAAPVAFLAPPRLVLQRVVAGQSLNQLLGDRRGGGRDLGSSVRRAGAALAALHRAPEVSTRERPVEAELARFARRAAAVRSVRPEVGARLLAVAEALDRHGRSLPPARRGLVHGDCKPSQFLLRPGDEVALLDFDHCGVADPASDVGTFLAALRRRRVSGAAPPGAHDLSAHFLAGYEHAGGSTPARVRWYEAVALVRAALRAFARAPRSPLPAALADEAMRCLTGAEGRAA